MHLTFVAVLSGKLAESSARNWMMLSQEQLYLPIKRFGNAANGYVLDAIRSATTQETAPIRDVALHSAQASVCAPSIHQGLLVHTMD